MPDENNNANGQQVNIVGYVTRNDISLPIVETKILRGKNKGTIYMTPDTSDLDKYLQWLGKDQLEKLVVPRTNAIAQGWTEEATNEENQFDFEKYSGFATSFSQRGESKADLIKQRDELTAEMSDYNPDDVNDLQKIIAIAKQIRALNEDIAAKKRERKKEGEEAPAAAPATA